MLIGVLAEVWDPGAFDLAPVDDLATALGSDSRLDVLEMTTTTVGGYDATRIDARIDDWQTYLDEDASVLRLWLGRGEPEGELVALVAPRPDGVPNGSFWVVDVDGIEVLIAACYEDEHGDVFAAELQSIVDSMEFAPPVGEPRVTKTLRTDGDEIVIANGSPRLHAAVEWALGRFVAAGVGLPELESVTFSAQSECLLMAGSPGAIQIGRDVCLCFGEGNPELSIRRRLLHEFGHAWTDARIDATTMHRFLEARGLEAWDGEAIPYEQRGAEQSAEILAWGLFGEPVPTVRLPDVRCATLTEAFTILTGKVPSTDSDPAVCSP